MIASSCEDHGKTPGAAHPALAGERDIVAIPKMASRRRMEGNLAVFDFALSTVGMAAIRELDEKASTWLAYDDPRIVEMVMP